MPQTHSYPNGNVLCAERESAAHSSLADCITALLGRLPNGRAGVVPGCCAGDDHDSHLAALEWLTGQGFYGEWHYGRLDDIIPEQFPAILKCCDGAYCVVLAPPRDDTVEVICPAQSGRPAECLTSSVRSMHDGLYLLCKRDNARGPGAAAYGDWLFGAVFYDEEPV